MARDERDDERLHGVSLAQLAAVHAALAEPFPIRRVLALEGIEGPVFRQAEAAWKQRMADDLVTSGRYQAHLVAAEDRLVRMVTPLHKDGEAWAMFQASYQAHPAQVLRSTDLGGNDVARLQRFWAKQMEADEALKARLVAILSRGARGLPSISAGPRELRPSPEARGGALPAPQATAPPTPATDAHADAEGLDVYVELTVELETSPADAARILARYGLPSDEARAALVRRWEARFTEDPSLRRDFRTLTAHYGTQRRAPPATSPAPPPLREAVSFSVPVVTPIPLPVQPSVSEPAVVSAVVPSTSPSADAGGTMDVARLIAEPALPFRQGAMVSFPVPSHEGEAPAPSGDAGGTMDVAQLISGPSLPFREGAKAFSLGETPKPPPEASQLPPEEEAPAPTGDAGGTMDVAQFLASAALPFQEGAAPRASVEPPAPAALPDLGVEQYAALHVERRHAPAATAEILRRHGLTAESAARLDAHWRARCADPAVYAAFSRACQAYEAAQPASALPNLSIEQYASLSVDLLLDSRHHPEILARYGLTEAQMTALTAAWSARFSRDPAARATFSQASATYREWLARRGR